MTATYTRMQIFPYLLSCIGIFYQVSHFPWYVNWLAINGSMSATYVCFFGTILPGDKYHKLYLVKLAG